MSYTDPVHSFIISLRTVEPTGSSFLKMSKKTEFFTECRVFPFSRLTTESLLHFKRMKKHWDMQKHQDQRKICINANLSTRSSAFEAGDCCVGLWPPGTIRGHWVGGACWREGPQRSGCSLILGQVSSLISNRTQGKFSSDPGLLIVYPSSATNS